MAKTVEGKAPAIDTPVEVATQESGAASTHVSEGEIVGTAGEIATEGFSDESPEGLGDVPAIPLDFYKWSSEGINFWNRVKDECFAEGSGWERKVVAGHGFLVRALPDGTNVHRPDSYVGHDIVGQP